MTTSMHPDSIGPSSSVEASTVVSSPQPQTAVEKTSKNFSFPLPTEIARDFENVIHGQRADRQEASDASTVGNYITPNLATLIDEESRSTSGAPSSNVAIITTPAQTPKPAYQRTSSSSSVGGIKKSKKDFDIGEPIGEGSYSEVYQVRDLTPPNRLYALKVLNKRHITREKKIQYVHIEKNALTRLHKHPGVVRLFWTFHDVDSLYFVLELASNGEILKWIRHYGSFAFSTTQYYSGQITDALKWIHDHGIIHRDLKPENILLDSEWRVKITDFGTAKILPDAANNANNSTVIDTNAEEEERANSFVGTAEYVSPELLTQRTAYKSSDCWALGCIIYQLLCGRPPFKAASEYLTFQQIIACNYSFPEECPEVPKDLIAKLLILDWKKRPNVKEVMTHNFFEGFDWETLWTRDPTKMESGFVKPTKREDSQKIWSEMEWAAGEEEQDEEDEEGVGAGDKAKEEEVVKASEWSSVLRDNELVVFSSSVKEKARLPFFPTKFRTLILTNCQRLLVIKEGEKSEVKFQINVMKEREGSNETTLSNPGTASTNGPWNGNAESRLRNVRVDGTKILILELENGKALKFEDCLDQAGKWKAEIEKLREGR